MSQNNTLAMELQPVQETDVLLVFKGLHLRERQDITQHLMPSDILPLWSGFHEASHPTNTKQISRP